MFKIEEIKFNNLVELKYENLDNKEKIEDISFRNEKIKLEKNIEIVDSKFDSIIFEKTDIKFSKLENIEFINCDLSNINFYDTNFYKVRFKNCKLFGINLIDVEFNNVIIEDSMCNMSNMADLKILNSKISNSNFKDSRFMSCNFKNLIIEYIDFSNSEFIDTSLKDIDLSSSKINNIKINLNNIKGCIVSFEQSMDLIGLLEIKIKE